MVYKLNFCHKITNWQDLLQPNMNMVSLFLVRSARPRESLACFGHVFVARQRLEADHVRSASSRKNAEQVKNRTVFCFMFLAVRLRRPGWKINASIRFFRFESSPTSNRNFGTFQSFTFFSRLSRIGACVYNIVYWLLRSGRQSVNKLKHCSWDRQCNSPRQTKISNFLKSVLYIHSKSTNRTQ